MTLPRFRCAQEVAFIPGPNGMQRVQLNDEFNYDERFTIIRNGEEVTIPPGPWMDPVNDEAVALVQNLVKAKKRKSVSAEKTADTVPVQPPKSGISLSLEQTHAATPAAPTPAQADREPPRRRKAS